WSPCERKDLSNRAKEACTLERVQKRNILQHEWRTIKEEELEELVQEMTLRQIAVKYNVSPTDTVSKKCRRLRVSLPERGYWTKVYWANARPQGRDSKRKRKNPIHERETTFFPLLDL
nr:hypothetical protein [Candidatus Njordarchaeum guaymaensis]